STCLVEHNAIAHANSCSKEGYLTPGMGAAMCACHVLVCQNGISDLQKGDKYCNMDYMLR
ncbi:hypothetical protein HYDPIDRAFT_101021, partial [Hydnomerulius pinastri MD-312]